MKFEQSFSGATILAAIRHTSSIEPRLRSSYAKRTHSRQNCGVHCACISSLWFVPRLYQLCNFTETLRFRVAAPPAAGSGSSDCEACGPEGPALATGSEGSAPPAKENCSPASPSRALWPTSPTRPAGPATPTAPALSAPPPEELEELEELEGWSRLPSGLSQGYPLTPAQQHSNANQIPLISSHSGARNSGSAHDCVCTI